MDVSEQRPHLPAMRALAQADVQRRAIERALHDGVLQELVALAVSLQLVRRALDDDPPRARALLDDVADDTRRALEQARVVSEEVYPSLLESQGLARALGAAASRVGVSLRIESELGRHPAAVETGVYFTVAATIASAPPGARIVLRRSGERIDVRVTGAGPESMSLARDRVVACGGTDAVEDGALVLSIPLYDPFSER